MSSNSDADRARWVGFRVVAPAFVAGFEVDPVSNRVVETAPILRRWLLGKTSGEARRIILQRGWKYESTATRYDPRDLDRV